MQITSWRIIESDLDPELPDGPFGELSPEENRYLVASFEAGYSVEHAPDTKTALAMLAVEAAHGGWEVAPALQDITSWKRPNAKAAKQKLTLFVSSHPVPAFKQADWVAPEPEPEPEPAPPAPEPDPEFLRAQALIESMTAEQVHALVTAVLAQTAPGA